ncbi:MAG: HD domain-containing protein [Clostridia bacterium]|nr:HD domain-containing protein [Clostridia bacterium]
MQNKIIKEAVEFVQSLFQGNSDGHDFNHTMRVYHTAMEIAESEPICDKLVVALAALLHDADDHKLFETKKNANARAFLDSQNVDEATTMRICMAINSVSFSKNRGKCPELLEGKIVQDADRLDAIGAIGIARTFAYGGKHGRSLDSSIEHFHEKLLLLKDMMHTEKAKKLAESRHTFMEEFLKEWDKEMEKK